VLRKAFQVASLACLIALSLLYPIIESLDRWDAPGPSSDSEITIIVLLTFVGMVFVLGHVLTSSALSVSTDALPYLCSGGGAPIHAHFFALYPRVTASPPLSLRIWSLRIWHHSLVSIRPLQQGRVFSACQRLGAFHVPHPRALLRPNPFA